MLNAISNIQKLYQISRDDPQNGLSQDVITQAETVQNAQLPTPLFHYYRELGNFVPLNQTHNRLLPLPLNWIGEYLVFFEEEQRAGVWGIHQEDLAKHDPMVYMSQNFDAIESSEVHWHADRTLQAFLLAQAIFNGTMGGLDFCQAWYDFTEDLPDNLIQAITEHYAEIPELSTSYEQYFTEDFITVIMVTLSDGVPTAVFVGSQYKTKFETALNFLKI